LGIESLSIMPEFGCQNRATGRTRRSYTAILRRMSAAVQIVRARKNAGRSFARTVGTKPALQTFETRRSKRRGERRATQDHIMLGTTALLVASALSLALIVAFSELPPPPE
jgi:Flp pilus assembly protein TadB